MSISIHDVTKDNEDEILRLSVAESQTNFIETTRQCLEEAKECAHYQPVGLYANNELVGFAMYGCFPEAQEQSRVWLDRFLIDANFQGLGYGTIMLQSMIEKLVQEFSCQKIYLSIYEDNHSAIYLYQKFGFQFNGEFDVNDEKVMVKNI
ncbi:GNAT family N-acetyltransferase [Sporosarcina sp. ANT_H38]|uniref:GNAT family N-acetyltransferase n=1 Tax=Sporosarcina sp. ANT_H38 TaxID=2597358 RepID=UPI0011F1CB75|nr:GNAT family N-acetyltransferase [Sporosarcina sp. ANT_H38]KAA0965719.1 GNAT family N-acetyltransferase [Sporosarcina sp. ANT_H38]